uniref:WGS project CAEQ00000000 data, annotated contig 740 n=1 Tax=Trypanosoma congolense (strain IL3000) TaxID=1068625 RepID=F9WI76_TRYCI|nr:unnamed protein product [Trypanosoma congolense IL3000]
MQSIDLSPLGAYCSSDVTVRDAVVSAATFYLWERLYGTTEKSSTRGKIKLYLSQHKQLGPHVNLNEPILTSYSSEGVSSLPCMQTPLDVAPFQHDAVSVSVQHGKDEKNFHNGSRLTGSEMAPVLREMPCITGSAADSSRFNVRTENYAPFVGTPHTNSGERRKQGRNTEVFREYQSSLPLRSSQPLCRPPAVTSRLVVSSSAARTEQNPALGNIVMSARKSHRTAVSKESTLSQSGSAKERKTDSPNMLSKTFTPHNNRRSSEVSKILSLTDSDDDSETSDDETCVGNPCGVDDNFLQIKEKDTAQLLDSSILGECPEGPEKMFDSLGKEENRQRHEEHASLPALPSTDSQEINFHHAVEAFPIFMDDRHDVFTPEENCLPTDTGTMFDSSSDPLPYIVEGEGPDNEVGEPKKVRQYQTPWFCVSNTSEGAAGGKVPDNDQVGGDEKKIVSPTCDPDGAKTAVLLHSQPATPTAVITSTPCCASPLLSSDRKSTNPPELATQETGSPQRDKQQEKASSNPSPTQHQTDRDSQKEVRWGNGGIYSDDSVMPAFSSDESVSEKLLSFAEPTKEAGSGPETSDLPACFVEGSHTIVPPARGEALSGNYEWAKEVDSALEEQRRRCGFDLLPSNACYLSPPKAGEFELPRPLRSRTPVCGQVGNHEYRMKLGISNPLGEGDTRVNNSLPSRIPGAPLSRAAPLHNSGRKRQTGPGRSAGATGTKAVRRPAPLSPSSAESFPLPREVSTTLHHKQGGKKRVREN